MPPRVLELLASAAGCELSPREASEAAAVAASEADDWVEAITRAVRQVGLHAAGYQVEGRDELERLRELEIPALTKVDERWLVVRGTRAGALDLTIIDELGEQSRPMRAVTLLEWLAEHTRAGLPMRWLAVEARQPLASAVRIGSPIRRLIELARLERSDLGVVVVLAMAIGAASLAVPIAVQALVNTVANMAMLQPLVVLGVLLLLVLGFVGLLRVAQTIVVERIQQRLFVRVAIDFARRLPRLAAGSSERRDGPELVNRFFEVVNLQKSAAALLLDGTALALQIAVGLLLLGFYHPWLLAFDIMLLLGIVAVLMAGRGAISTSLAESRQKYAMAAWLEQLAGAPQQFTDARSRNVADARAELLAREWLSARGKHFQRLLRQVIGGIGLQVAASVGLLAVGGWLVIERQLTLGQLVAAELVVALIGAGLGKLGKHLENFYDAATAAAKLGRVLDAPLEPADANEEHEPLPTLQFGSPLLVTRPSLLVSRSPKPARLLARMLGALLLAGLLALVLVPWQQSLPGSGRVIAYAPLERQQTIEAPIEGRIQTWFVQEGSRVSAGDPIAEITDNDPEILARLERERQAVEARRSAAQSSVEVSKAKIAALEQAREAKSTSASLRVYIGRDRQEAAARAVEATEAAERAAKLHLLRTRALFEDGLSSKRELELAEFELESRVAEHARAKATLKASMREIGALDADAETLGAGATADIEEARNSLAKAESELAKADADLQKLAVRLARQQRMTITAPRDGTILRLIAKQGAEMVVAGDPVVAFAPDISSSAVELWLMGKDGPLVSPGRKVRVQFEGWPAVQFVGWPSAATGTFGGVVAFMDATADERGRLRVVVTPDPDDEPWPDSRWLRQGVRANGWVLLDQVRLGFEFWRQLNGFPPVVEELGTQHAESTLSKPSKRDDDKPSEEQE